MHRLSKINAVLDTNRASQLIISELLINLWRITTAVHVYESEHMKKLISCISNADEKFI